MNLLWLPQAARGSLAIIAITITGLMLLRGNPVPGEWWVTVTAIISFYFGSRTAQENGRHA